MITNSQSLAAFPVNWIYGNRRTTLDEPLRNVPKSQKCLYLRNASGLMLLAQQVVKAGDEAVVVSTVIGAGAGEAEVVGAVRHG